MSNDTFEAALRAGGFRHSHSLGQNFISDPELLGRIADASGVGKDDNVLEIGAGAGTLTCALAARAGRVAAVEIDDALIPILRVTLFGLDNVRLIHGDIMKLDLPALVREQFDGRPFHVVANLPYYITTPIIMLLVEGGLPIESITVMVQKEVAERLTAAPGSRDCGAITHAVQYRMSSERVMDVPAACFTPPPKVDSAVIVLRRRSEPPVRVKNEATFFRVVSAAFAMRRKTMLNNLCASFGLTKDTARALLAACGMDERVRGEALDMQALACLSDALDGMAE